MSCKRRFNSSSPSCRSSNFKTAAIEKLALLGSNLSSLAGHQTTLQTSTQVNHLKRHCTTRRTTATTAAGEAECFAHKHHARQMAPPAASRLFPIHNKSEDMNPKRRPDKLPLPVRRRFCVVYRKSHSRHSLATQASLAILARPLAQSW